MFSNFTTPNTKHGKLQKPSTRAQGHDTPRGECPPCSPSPHSSQTSTIAGLNHASQNVNHSSHVTRTGDLRTRVPLLKPTVRRAATKSQTGTGDGRREVIIMEDVVAAKSVNSFARNGPNSDAGVVLSPPRSPDQSSQAAVECPANTEQSSTAPGESPSSERPKQTKVPCDDNLKQNEGISTKDLPALPTSQRQKRQLRCPSRSPKAMQTVLTSSSTSNGGGIPAVAASFLPMLPPTSSQPLRTSTYPIPMVRSPLLDNAIFLRPNSSPVHNSIDGSISSGSSSSSFQRLVRRGSQKFSSNKRSLYPPRTAEHVSPPRPSSGDQLDCLSSLPYETLPATGTPPTFISKPVTPQIIAHATTPVTALPRVAESACVCLESIGDKKNKQGGGRFWSFLSRNPARSSAQRGSGESRQRTFGQQRILKNEGARSSCCGQGNHCFHCSSLKRQASSVSNEDCQHAQRQAQQPIDCDQYTTKTLPRPPLPPSSANSTNQRLSTRTSKLELEDEDRDPIATRRHRRRALFALDGLTYSGTEISRRAPPPLPPPPPSKSGSIIDASPRQTVQYVQLTPPAVAHSRTLPPSQPSLITPTGRSRMSEEVKRAFIRRGREAESRVFSAHICAEARARMAVTGDSVSPSSGDGDLGGMSRPQAGREMNAKMTDRDLEGQSPAESKAEEETSRIIADAKPERNAASSTYVRRSIRLGSAEEPLQNDVVHDLEFASVASSHRENCKTAPGPTLFLPLTHEHTVPTTSKRTAPPPPPPSSEQVPRHASSQPGNRRLQSDQHKQSFQRGRQLARDTFRKHRDAGRWDLAVVHDEKSLGEDIGNLSGDRQPQVRIQIPRRAWEKDDTPESSTEEVVKAARAAPTTSSAPDYGKGPDPGSASGSTSSSSASLNATVFRVFKGKNEKKNKKHKAAKPPLDAFEAAHAVQSNCNAELTPSSSHGSHGSSGFEGAQRRDLQPKPLSLRSRASGTLPEPAGEVTALVGLGIENGAPEQHGLLNGKATEGEGAVKDQRRRQSPPPPPSCAPLRTSQASYLPLPFRAASSAAASQQTPSSQRRPAPPPPRPRNTPSPQRSATPPIPPKSALRPRLGVDWSGQGLDKIRHGVLLGAQTPQRRSLDPVTEEARHLPDHPMQDGKARQRQQAEENATKLPEARDGEESDDGFEPDEDDDRFWSDDDDAAAREGGSSKKTTPEKDGVWVPPCWSESKGGEPAGEADGNGPVAGGADEESQLLGYYLDVQREEEERELRAVREVDREMEARAATEADEARRREDEARAKRVAHLLAKVRAGVMD